MLNRYNYNAYSYQLTEYFLADEDISQITARVYGILAAIPVPFPLDKPDVCKDPDDGVNCPLQGNHEYHYTTALLVKKKFPSVIRI